MQTTRRALLRGLQVVSMMFVLSTFNVAADRAFAVQRAPYLNETSSVQVMMYHHITDHPIAGDTSAVTPVMFRQQLQYFANNGFRTLTLSELEGQLNACPPSLNQTPKEIVLTFDDGYDDFYTIVYPLLKQYQMHAVFFPIINYIGDPPGLRSTNRHVTASQLVEMDQSGLVDIGSHTMSHPYLAKKKDQITNAALSDEDIDFELQESQRVLQDILGHPVRSFAYPHGDFDAKVEQIAAKYYSIAFTTQEFSLTCSSSSQRLRLGRYKAPQEGFNSNTSFYLPVIPDPSVGAGKIKVAMAAILNNARHTTISRNDKILFFATLEKTEYFWKNADKRKAIRVEMLAKRVKFSDGTPWAYVLADGEINAQGNLGVSTNEQEAPKVAYNDSRTNFDGIQQQHSSSSSEAQTPSTNPSLERVSGAGVRGALKTVEVVDQQVTIGGEVINTSTIFKDCSLSIAKQQQIISLLSEAITNTKSFNRSANSIRVVTAPDTFELLKSPFLITPDGFLVFDQNIFVSGNRSEIESSINQGIQAWLSQ